MHDYFLRLFVYNNWANHQTLAGLGNPEKAPVKALGLFAHVLAAEAVWLARLKGQVSDGVIIFPEYSLIECQDKANEMNKLWLDYLENLTKVRFANPVHYLTSKGVPQTTVVSDILAHVVNHGSHHRGQIALLFRQAGITPAVTDFIYFARQK